MHIGIISSPVPGHINPMCALSRSLLQRGHSVTFFTFAHAAKKVHAEGISYCIIGEKEFPEQSFFKHWGPMMSSSGVFVNYKTIRLHHRLAVVMCRYIPTLIKNLNIDLLLIDQVQYQGRSIAEKANCPFITIACALHVNRGNKNYIPAPFKFGTCRNTGILWNIRNRLAWMEFDIFSRTIMNAGKKYFKNVNKFKTVEETFSSLGQIIPMPAALDWPINHINREIFHYVGSLTDEHNQPVVHCVRSDDTSSPVYVSFGTLQNRNYHALRLIDNAVTYLKQPCIMGLGNWLNESDNDTFQMQSGAISYAPQKSILRHASLCITHGGMNTVIEALSSGVPLLVIPVANDQPGNAMRVLASEVGTVIKLHELTFEVLVATITELLNNPKYKENAMIMSQHIKDAGGCERAANIIEAISRDIGLM